MTIEIFLLKTFQNYCKLLENLFYLTSKWENEIKRFFINKEKWKTKIVLVKKKIDSTWNQFLNWKDKCNNKKLKIEKSEVNKYYLNKKVDTKLKFHIIFKFGIFQVASFYLLYSYIYYLYHKIKKSGIRFKNIKFKLVI